MTMLMLPVCPIAGVRAVELTPDRAPELQEFFDQNPAYFLATAGEPAGPTEAYEEITGEVPAGWIFTKKWVVGYANEDGKLIALTNVISDLLAPGVFHIGTFIVATAQHGTGVAQEIYSSLERWSVDGGAQWMRLGVVEGNIRAERFWTSCGYISVKKQRGIQMGSRSVAVQNMVKPLLGEGLESYFALVPRDRLEAEGAA